ncbi:MAG: hypothetical protein WBV26_08420 [Candidatus Sulfotelmatobacter sp.]
MAQPTDEPNVRILPDPELNPLLNPLLGAHMGRWAEVYFTTPPEKRAQAVSELVRELMKNPTPDNVTAQRNNDERMLGRLEDLPEQAEVSGPSVEEATLICENCGHNNSALQRFCGMCGSPLTLAPESDQQQVAEAAPLAVARWDAPEPPIPGGPNPSEPYSDADFISRGENFTASESSTLFSTEASPVEFRSLSQYQPEPSSHSYRVYVGVLVTLLLALLVYITWRGNTAFWSSATAIAPATLPRAVPTPSGEPQAGTPSKPTETATTQPSSANKRELTSAPAVSPPQNQEQTNESTENNPSIKARPTPRIVAVSASSGGGAAGQNGSEELATAEKYLNAGPGMARDSRQAATWLWKAVAKQNLTATMLLSDLYLRGDGVTKSCDQARLLLDAATRKGGTAAAERLRNLPAFGCQ